MSIYEPVQHFLGKLQDLEVKTAVSIDIDNTIAFFTPHILAVINAKFGTDYKIKDQKEPGLHFLKGDELAYAVQQHDDPDFFRTMAPDYAAIAAVQAIYNAGYHVIIGSSRVPEVEEASIKWLNQWSVPYNEVFVGHHVKNQILKNHPVCMFIDDNPGMADKVANTNAKVRLLRRPYTGNISAKGDIRVVDTWSQILAELNVPAPKEIQQLTVAPSGWQS